jgi:hypothetical protein
MIRVDRGDGTPMRIGNLSNCCGVPPACSALSMKRDTGAELWEYYKKNPEEAAEFSAAMTGMTAIVSKEVAEIVDTRSVEVAADIGGSGGALVHALMESNPRLRGILFDLPEVIATASVAPRDRVCHFG